MSQEMVWGVARALLSAGGGYLVGAGLIDQSMANELIGALGVVFAAGWSIWAKKSAA